MQKLNILNNLLGAADYAGFWATLDSDDLYADLIADVAGFEELMCVRIAVTVSQAVREIERVILESWLNKKGNEFEHFVGQVCGWSIEGDVVKVPLNKENEAKGTVVRENVKFDRKFFFPSALPLEEFVTNDACRVLEVDQARLRAARIDAWRGYTKPDDISPYPPSLQPLSSSFPANRCGYSNHDLLLLFFFFFVVERYLGACKAACMHACI